MPNDNILQQGYMPDYMGTPDNISKGIDLMGASLIDPVNFQNDMMYVNGRELSPLKPAEYYKDFYLKNGYAPEKYDEYYKAIEQQYSYLKSRPYTPAFNPIGSQWVGYGVSSPNSYINIVPKWRDVAPTEFWSPEEVASRSPIKRLVFDEDGQMKEVNTDIENDFAWTFKNTVINPIITALKGVVNLSDKSHSIYGKNVSSNVFEYLSLPEIAQRDFNKANEINSGRRKKYILQPSRDEQNNPTGDYYYLEVDELADIGQNPMMTLFDNKKYSQGLKDGLYNGIVEGILGQVIKLPGYILHAVTFNKTVFNDIVGRLTDDNYQYGLNETDYKNELAQLDPNDIDGKTRLLFKYSNAPDIATRAYYNQLTNYTKAVDFGTMSEEDMAKGAFGSLANSLNTVGTVIGSLIGMKGATLAVRAIKPLAKIGKGTKTVNMFGKSVKFEVDAVTGLIGGLQAVGPQFEYYYDKTGDLVHSSYLALSQLPAVAITEAFLTPGWLFADDVMSVNNVRRAVVGNVIAKADKEGVDLVSNQGQRWFAKQYVNASKKMTDAWGELSKRNWILGGVREGIQESSEEMIYAATEKMFEANNWFGEDIDLSSQNFWQRMGENGLGGFIAGMLLGAGINNNKTKTQKDWMLSIVMNGQVKEAEDKFYKIWSQTDGFADSHIDVKGNVIKTDKDGNPLGETQPIGENNIKGLESGILRTANDVYYYNAYNTLHLWDNLYNSFKGENPQFKLDYYLGDVDLVKESMKYYEEIKSSQTEINTVNDSKDIPDDMKQQQISQLQNNIKQAQKKINDLVMPERTTVKRADENGNVTEQEIVSPYSKELRLRLLKKYVDIGMRSTTGTVLKQGEDTEFSQDYDGFVKFVNDRVASNTAKHQEIKTKVDRIEKVYNDISKISDDASRIKYYNKVPTIKDDIASIYESLDTMEHSGETTEHIDRLEKIMLGLDSRQNEKIFPDMYADIDGAIAPDRQQKYKNKPSVENNTTLNNEYLTRLGLEYFGKDINRTVMELETTQDMSSDAAILKLASLKSDVDKLKRKITYNVLVDSAKREIPMLLEAAGENYHPSVETTDANGKEVIGLGNLLPKKFMQTMLNYSSIVDNDIIALNKRIEVDKKLSSKRELHRLRAIMYKNMEILHEIDDPAVNDLISDFFKDKIDEDGLIKSIYLDTNKFDNTQYTELKLKIIALESEIYKRVKNKKQFIIKYISENIGADNSYTAIDKVTNEWQAVTFSVKDENGNEVIKTYNEITFKELNQQILTNPNIENEFRFIVKQHITSYKTNYINNIVLSDSKEFYKQLASKYYELTWDGNKKHKILSIEQEVVARQIYAYHIADDFYCTTDASARLIDSIKTKDTDYYGFAINGSAGAGKTDILIPMIAELESGNNIHMIMADIATQTEYKTKVPVKTKFYSVTELNNVVKAAQDNDVIILDEYTRISVIDFRDIVRPLIKKKNIKFYALGDFLQSTVVSMYDNSITNTKTEELPNLHSIASGGIRANTIDRVYRGGYVDNNADQDAIRNNLNKDPYGNSDGYTKTKYYKDTKVRAGVQYFSSLEDIWNEWMEDEKGVLIVSDSKQRDHLRNKLTAQKSIESILSNIDEKKKNIRSIFSPDSKKVEDTTVQGKTIENVYVYMPSTADVMKQINAMLAGKEQGDISSLMLGWNTYILPGESFHLYHKRNLLTAQSRNASYVARIGPIDQSTQVDSIDDMLVEKKDNKEYKDEFDNRKSYFTRINAELKDVAVAETKTSSATTETEKIISLEEAIESGVINEEDLETKSDGPDIYIPASVETTKDNVFINDQDGSPTDIGSWRKLPAYTTEQEDAVSQLEQDHEIDTEALTPLKDLTTDPTRLMPIITAAMKFDGESDAEVMDETDYFKKVKQSKLDNLADMINKNQRFDLIFIPRIRLWTKISNRTYAGRQHYNILAAVKFTTDTEYEIVGVLPDPDTNMKDIIAQRADGELKTLSSQSQDINYGDEAAIVSKIKFEDASNYEDITDDDVERLIQYNIALVKLRTKGTSAIIGDQAFAKVGILTVMPSLSKQMKLKYKKQATTLNELLADPDIEINSIGGNPIIMQERRGGVIKWVANIRYKSEGNKYQWTQIYVYRGKLSASDISTIVSDSKAELKTIKTDDYKDYRNTLAMHMIRQNQRYIVAYVNGKKVVKEEYKKYLDISKRNELWPKGPKSKTKENIIAALETLTNKNAAILYAPSPISKTGKTDGFVLNLDKESQEELLTHVNEVHLPQLYGTIEEKGKADQIEDISKAHDLFLFTPESDTKPDYDLDIVESKNMMSLFLGEEFISKYAITESNLSHNGEYYRGFVKGLNIYLNRDSQGKVSHSATRHEPVHIIINYMVPKDVMGIIRKDAIAAMNEVDKRRYGNSDKMIDEWIAIQFHTEDYKKLKGKKSNAWNRIIDFFKDIARWIGILDTHKSDYIGFLKDIENGRYVNAPLLYEQTTDIHGLKENENDLMEIFDGKSELVNYAKSLLRQHIISNSWADRRLNSNNSQLYEAKKKVLNSIKNVVKNLVNSGYVINSNPIAGQEKHDYVLYKLANDDNYDAVVKAIFPAKFVLDDTVQTELPRGQKRGKGHIDPMKYTEVADLFFRSIPLKRYYIRDTDGAQISESTGRFINIKDLKMLLIDASAKSRKAMHNPDVHDMFRSLREMAEEGFGVGIEAEDNTNILKSFLEIFDGPWGNLTQSEKNELVKQGGQIGYYNFYEYENELKKLGISGLEDKIELVKNLLRFIKTYTTLSAPATTITKYDRIKDKFTTVRYNESDINDNYQMLVRSISTKIFTKGGYQSHVNSAINDPKTKNTRYEINEYGIVRYSYGEQTGEALLTFSNGHFEFAANNFGSYRDTITSINSFFGLGLTKKMRKNISKALAQNIELNISRQELADLFGYMFYSLKYAYETGTSKIALESYIEKYINESFSNATSNVGKSYISDEELEVLGDDITKYNPTSFTHALYQLARFRSYNSKLGKMHYYTPEGDRANRIGELSFMEYMFPSLDRKGNSDSMREYFINRFNADEEFRMLSPLVYRGGRVKTWAEPLIGGKTALFTIDKIENYLGISGFLKKDLNNLTTTDMWNQVLTSFFEYFDVNIKSQKFRMIGNVHGDSKVRVYTTNFNDMPLYTMMHEKLSKADMQKQLDEIEASKELSEDIKESLYETIKNKKGRQYIKLNEANINEVFARYVMYDINMINNGIRRWAKASPVIRAENVIGTDSVKIDSAIKSAIANAYNKVSKSHGQDTADGKVLLADSFINELNKLGLIQNLDYKIEEFIEDGKKKVSIVPGNLFTHPYRSLYHQYLKTYEAGNIKDLTDLRRRIFYRRYMESVKAMKNGYSKGLINIPKYVKDAMPAGHVFYHTVEGKMKWNPYLELMQYVHFFTSKSISNLAEGNFMQFKNTKEHEKYAKLVSSGGFVGELGKPDVLPEISNVVCINDPLINSELLDKLGIAYKKQETFNGLVFRSQIAHELYVNSIGGNLSTLENSDSQVKDVYSYMDHTTGIASKVKKSTQILNKDLFENNPLIKSIYLRMLEGTPNAKKDVNLRQVFEESYNKYNDFDKANKAVIKAIKKNWDATTQMSDNYISEIVFSSTMKGDKSGLNYITLEDFANGAEVIYKKQNNNYNFLQQVHHLSNESSKDNQLLTLSAIFPSDVADTLREINAEYTKRNDKPLIENGKTGLFKMVRNMLTKSLEKTSVFSGIHELFYRKYNFNIPTITGDFRKALAHMFNRGIQVKYPGNRTSQSSGELYLVADVNGHPVPLSEAGEGATGRSLQYYKIVNINGDEVDRTNPSAILKPSELVTPYRYTKEFGLGDNTSVNDVVTIAFTKEPDKKINIIRLLKATMAQEGKNYYNHEQRRAYYPRIEKLIRDNYAKNNTLTNDSFVASVVNTPKFISDYITTFIDTLFVRVVHKPTPNVATGFIAEILGFADHAYVPAEYNAVTNADYDYDEVDVKFVNLVDGSDIKNNIPKIAWPKNNEIRSLSKNELQTLEHLTLWNAYSDLNNLDYITQVVDVTELKDIADKVNKKQLFEDGDLARNITSIVNAQNDKIGLFASMLNDVYRLMYVHRKNPSLMPGLTGLSDNKLLVAKNIATYLQLVIDEIKEGLSNILEINATSSGIITAMILKVNTAQEIQEFIMNKDIKGVIDEVEDSLAINASTIKLRELISTLIKRNIPLANLDVDGVKEYFKQRYTELIKYYTSLANSIGNDTLKREDAVDAYSLLEDIDLSEIGYSDYSMTQLNEEIMDSITKHQDKTATTQLTDIQEKINKYSSKLNNPETLNKIAEKFYEKMNKKMMQYHQLYEYSILGEVLRDMNQVTNIYSKIDNDEWWGYNKRNKIEQSTLLSIEELLYSKKVPSASSNIANKYGEYLEGYKDDYQTDSDGNRIAAKAMNETQEDFNDYIQRFRKALVPLLEKDSIDNVEFVTSINTGIEQSIHDAFKEATIVAPKYGYYNNEYGQKAKRDEQYYSTHKFELSKEAKNFDTRMGLITGSDMTIAFQAVLDPYYYGNPTVISVDMNRGKTINPNEVAKIVADKIKEKSRKVKEGSKLRVYLTGNNMIDVYTRNISEYDNYVKVATDKRSQVQLAEVIREMPDIMAYLESFNKFMHLAGSSGRKGEGIIKYSNFATKLVEDIANDMGYPAIPYEAAYYDVVNGLTKMNIYDFIKEQDYTFTFKPFAELDSISISLNDFSEMQKFVYLMPQYITTLVDNESALSDNAVFSQLANLDNKIEFLDAQKITEDNITFYRSEMQRAWDYFNDNPQYKDANPVDMLSVWYMISQGFTYSNQGLAAMLPTTIFDKYSSFIEYQSALLVHKYEINDPLYSESEAAKERLRKYRENIIIDSDNLIRSKKIVKKKNLDPLFVTDMESQTKGLEVTHKIKVIQLRVAKDEYKKVWNMKSGLLNVIPTDESIVSFEEVVKPSTAEEYYHMSNGFFAKQFHFMHNYKEDQRVVVGNEYYDLHVSDRKTIQLIKADVKRTTVGIYESMRNNIESKKVLKTIEESLGIPFTYISVSSIGATIPNSVDIVINDNIDLYRTNVSALHELNGYIVKQNNLLYEKISKVFRTTDHNKIGKILSSAINLNDKSKIDIVKEAQDYLSSYYSKILDMNIEFHQPILSNASLATDYDEGITKNECNK